MSIYFLHVWRDGHPEQGAVPFVFWPIASWNINISHSQDYRQHRTTPGNAVRYPTFDGGCHPQETCLNSMIGVRFYRLSGRLTCIEACHARSCVIWCDMESRRNSIESPKNGRSLSTLNEQTYSLFCLAGFAIHFEDLKPRIVDFL